MAGFKRNKVEPRTKELESFGDMTTALEAIASAVNAHSDEIDKLNGGVTLRDNTPGKLSLLKFQMPDDAPWRTDVVSSVAGQNGSISVLMEPGGRVRLKGSRLAGSGIYAGGIPNGSPLGTLNAGYRPISAGFVLPSAAVVGGAGSWGLTSVNTGGVLNYAGPGVGNPVYVDGVTFLATVAAAPHQFVGPGWPLIVRHDLERVRGLLVLGCRLVGQSGQNVGNGTPFVDWQDLGDGRLRVNGVWGLQWSQRYEMQVYLSPEEA